MTAPTKQLDLIAQTLFDKKGFNILALDVKEISSLAEYVIIAEGNIDRHVKALANSVRDKLHEAGINPLYIEGFQEGDWIILDYSDVVVHLFTPELREKYSLEQLWKRASVFNVHIEVKKPTGDEEEWLENA